MFSTSSIDETPLPSEKKPENKFGIDSLKRKLHGGGGGEDYDEEFLLNKALKESQLDFYKMLQKPKKNEFEDDEGEDSEIAAAEINALVRSPSQEEKNMYEDIILFGTFKEKLQ